MTSRSPYEQRRFDRARRWSLVGLTFSWIAVVLSAATVVLSILTTPA